jgi:hypothetical protein
MYKQQKKNSPQKNIYENFRRRRISLINKIDDLYRFFGADVYFVIRKKNRHYVYVSAINSQWPPTIEQIVRVFNLHKFNI